jgi:hypothetical protein
MRVSTRGQGEPWREGLYLTNTTHMQKKTAKKATKKVVAKVVTKKKK